MTTIAYILAFTAVSSLGFEAELKSAVEEYYGSLLEGKVLSWEMELKSHRLPKGEEYHVIAVRGEDDGKIPRGSRLCWVDLQVDERKHSVPVTLVIRPMELLPVANMVIPPRMTIVDSMITWKEIESTKLGATKIPAQGELINYWTKVTIPRGAVIDHRRLRLIPAVVIGQDVSLVSQVGVVEIRIAGKALEDGRVGERIKVLNKNSKTRLRGVVMPDKTVMVNR